MALRQLAQRISIPSQAFERLQRPAEPNCDEIRGVGKLAVG